MNKSTIHKYNPPLSSLSEVRQALEELSTDRITDADVKFLLTMSGKIKQITVTSSDGR